VRTLLGERDDAAAELCARRVLESLDAALPGRALLLGLALRERGAGAAAVRDVVAALAARAPWGGA